MIHYIYKIINNINNKLYIGYTSRIKPIERWKQHIKDMKILDRPLYRAMRKYGIQNFTFEIIYCSKNAKYTLDFMEKYFIIEYKSHITDWGYNLTLGGESNYGWKPSNELRKLWSTQRRGRKLSEEHKQKISEGGKLRFINNPELRDFYRQLAIQQNRKPISTPEMRKQNSIKAAITRTGKAIHTQERKNFLSKLFTENNPGKNETNKKKIKETWKKTGRGKGEKNGNAVFCKVFDPFNNLKGEGFLKKICDEINAPFQKFLLASRHQQPLQRGIWKDWKIIRIERC